MVRLQGQLANLMFCPPTEWSILIMSEWSSVIERNKQKQELSACFLYLGRCIGAVVKTFKKWTWLVWAILTCDWFIISFSFWLAIESYGCSKYLRTELLCTKMQWRSAVHLFTRTFSGYLYELQRHLAAAKLSLQNQSCHLDSTKTKRVHWFNSECRIKKKSNHYAFFQIHV